RMALHADLQAFAQLEDDLVVDPELPCQLVDPDLLRGQSRSRLCFLVPVSALVSWSGDRVACEFALSRPALRSFPARPPRGPSLARDPCLAGPCRWCPPSRRETAAGPGRAQGYRQRPAALGAVEALHRVVAAQPRAPAGAGSECEPVETTPHPHELGGRRR